MTQVYLIRHGDYVELEDGRYLDDPGLSSEGIGQVERLRDRLARTGEIKPDALITSTLRRARETAEILASTLGRPVTQERDLEEWRSDDGSLTPDEFNARWQAIPEALHSYVRVAPNGESWLEFAARAQLALNRITQEHEGQTIAIVTHGGVIQAAFLYFLGIGAGTVPGIAIANTGIVHWSRSDPTRKWTLVAFNDHHHLEE